MPCTISEAARLTGLTCHTIRYYEQAGLLNDIGRDSNGNRSFDEGTIEWLRYIACLRLTGMSVSRIRKIAELTALGDATIPERRRLLETQRKELRRKSDQLKSAFERLESKIAYYQRLEADTTGKAAGK